MSLEWNGWDNVRYPRCKAFGDMRLARRLFLLIAFAIYAGMAAAAPVPGDGVAGAVEGRRISRPPPEAGPLEKRAPLVPPGTSVWVVGSRIAAPDVIRTGRGEIFLAAGKSLVLVDPSDPSLQVEVRARNNEALYLGSIIALSRWRGIYAGLVGQRGQADAGTAVEGPNGVIVFKAVPGGPLVRGPVVAAGDRGGAAPEPVARKAPVIEATPAPPAAEASTEPSSPSAPAQHAAVALQDAAVKQGQPVSDSGTYESALRKLMEGQGYGGVRSVSELTRVHPAVDALRALRP